MASASHRICLTGANGFIGAPLHQALMQAGHDVLPYTRAAYGDLVQRADWSLLSGCDTLIHMAGRAHQTGKDADDEDAFIRDNVRATQSLLDGAKQYGVTHVIYISSIAVLGDDSGDSVLSLNAPYAPMTAYARSKMHAEQCMRETGMRTTIMRLPLVYGEGVKANMAALMRAVSRGVPLPFGSVHNRRNIVYLDNVVDALCRIVSMPLHTSTCLHIADAEPVSMRQLIEQCAQALHVSPRLLPVPVSWLNIAARMMGKQQYMQKLCGNLVFETAQSHHLLGWQPPVTTAEGLQRTAQWFKQQI